MIPKQVVDAKEDIPEVKTQEKKYDENGLTGKQRRARAYKERQKMNKKNWTT